SRERYGKPRSVVEEKINRWSGVMGLDEEDEDQENNLPSDRKFVNYKEKNNLAKPPKQKPEDPKPATLAKEKSKNSNEPKKLYKANCYECGKETEITFKPDGIRPVYCQSCFQKN